jgi:glycosyltransferase involved in cell wall biosynthesis
MKIEVLVSTMHQCDLSKYKSMNIQTDVLFINQCDQNDSVDVMKDLNRVKMISVKERGLSRSRNLAVSNASSDICLIADDDIVYSDGYNEIVMNAFETIPKADIIIFNIIRENYVGVVTKQNIHKIRRAPRYKSYSSVRIAFRLKSLIDNSIVFNDKLGAGAMFGAGEESLMLRDCIRKKLKIYEYPANIAKVDFSSSSWFDGYNEKFFYNKGAYLCSAYGLFMSHFFKYYYVFRLLKHTDFGVSTLLRNLNAGIIGYVNLMPYDEYIQGNV